MHSSRQAACATVRWFIVRSRVSGRLVYCRRPSRPMSGTESPTSGSIDFEDEPRSRRARTESMGVWLLRAGGLYGVYSASNTLYRIDIVEPACTCPDWQSHEPTGGCKHLRRVRQEIDAGAVPRPDGRLPANSAVSASASTRSEEAESATHQIMGSHLEFDRDGRPTGETYYRCSCGREVLQCKDLEAFGCDPKEGT